MRGGAVKKGDGEEQKKKPEGSKDTSANKGQRNLRRNIDI